MNRRLGLVLLHERANKDSLFEPYLSNLPNAFEGVPIFYVEDQLDAVQDSMFKQEVQQRHELCSES
ncbi:unnamed protein product [Discosporangium mesarthrocarpum]